jgi:hypothetical protein
VTGCDFLWAVCGVRGVWGARRCVPCCVWRARGGVHAVSYVCAVCSGWGCAGRRAGVPGLCSRMLRVSVACFVQCFG